MLYCRYQERSSLHLHTFSPSVALIKVVLNQISNAPTLQVGTSAVKIFGPVSSFCQTFCLCPAECGRCDIYQLICDCHSCEEGLLGHYQSSVFLKDNFKSVSGCKWTQWAAARCGSSPQQPVAAERILYFHEPSYAAGRPHPSGQRNNYLLVFVEANTAERGLGCASHPYNYSRPSSFSSSTAVKHGVREKKLLWSQLCAATLLHISYFTFTPLVNPLIPPPPVEGLCTLGFMVRKGLLREAHN